MNEKEPTNKINLGKVRKMTQKLRWRC